MVKFIVRRLMLLIPVLIGVSVIAFLMLHLAPGDPAELLAGLEASTEDIAALRTRFGLDKPLFVQYFMFLKGLFDGSLISQI